MTEEIGQGVAEVVGELGRKRLRAVALEANNRWRLVSESGWFSHRSDHLLSSFGGPTRVSRAEFDNDGALNRRVLALSNDFT
jgi:hypothetical protein